MLSCSRMLALTYIRNSENKNSHHELDRRTRRVWHGSAMAPWLQKGGVMRIVVLVASLMIMQQTVAHAGVSVEAGLTATRSSKPVASGGGSAFAAAWWFHNSFAISLANKEAYVSNDDVLTHFAVGLSAMKRLNSVGLRGAINLVHAHEQISSQVLSNVLATLLGVGTGTHHRAGASLAVDLIVPFRQRNNHEWFAAIGVDATAYLPDHHGSRWLWSTRATLGIMFGGRAAGR